MKFQAPKDVTHVFYAGAQHEVAGDGTVELPPGEIAAAHSALRPHGFILPGELRDEDDMIPEGIVIEGKGFGRFVVKTANGEALHKGYLSKTDAKAFARAYAPALRSAGGAA